MSEAVEPFGLLGSAAVGVDEGELRRVGPRRSKLVARGLEEAAHWVHRDIDGQEVARILAGRRLVDLGYKGRELFPSIVDRWL